MLIIEWDPCLWWTALAKIGIYRQKSNTLEDGIFARLTNVELMQLREENQSEVDVDSCSESRLSVNRRRPSSVMEISD